MSTFARLHLYLEIAKKGEAIAGEAVDKEFEEQINLSGFRWAVKRAGKGDGAQRGAGSDRVPAPEMFEISKAFDRASTTMLNMLTSETKLNAIVTLASHDESSFRCSFILNDVYLIDYKTNGKDGEKSSEFEEDWTLNYGTITLENIPELAPGEKTAKPMTSSHKRSAHAPTETSSTGEKTVLTAYKKLDTTGQRNVSAALMHEFKDNFK